MHSIRITEPVAIAIVLVIDSQMYVWIAAGDVPRAREASSVASKCFRAMYTSKTIIAPGESPWWATLAFRRWFVTHEKSRVDVSEGVARSMTSE